MHSTAGFKHFADELNSIVRGWIPYPHDPWNAAMYVAGNRSPIILSRAEVKARGRHGNDYVRSRVGQHQERVHDFYRGRVKKKTTDSKFTPIERNIIGGILEKHKPLKTDDGEWFDSSQLFKERV